ncbi:succinate--CoA ligase subunit alpha [Chloroflexota bacterium]
MSIILDKQPKVLVQAITGNQGRFHTEAMLRYGTNIVAGVTPGKEGQQVQGVPVYDTVAAAVREQDANTSIIFVPAAFVRNAVFEAIEAGIKTLIIISESVPQKDAIEFVARADKSDVIISGPNGPGIMSPPNRVLVGIMPAHIFKPGSIGMVSRSGTLTYEIAWHITNAGLGQSTCVGIGGDAIVGLDFIKVLEMFKNDKETERVVLIGEIGGNAEESASQYIRETKYAKPVIAYIAGRLAPPEKRMGHAGAIIMGNVGTAKSKIDAFAAAGVPVAEKPSDIVKFLKI